MTCGLAPGWSNRWTNPEQVLHRSDGGVHRRPDTMAVVLLQHPGGGMAEQVGDLLELAPSE